MSRRTLERLLTLSKSNSQYLLRVSFDHSLIRNVLELTRSINKFLPNLVSKLGCLDEIAYAEAKAHCELMQLEGVAVFR